jgi:hypothetical protein
MIGLSDQGKGTEVELRLPLAADLTLEMEC